MDAGMQGLQELCSEGSDEPLWHGSDEGERKGLQNAAGRVWGALLHRAVSMYHAFMATAYRPLRT
jgi:hypothetical protein